LETDVVNNQIEYNRAKNIFAVFWQQNGFDRILSSYIEEQATFKLPPNKEIIIAGGYDNNENCYTITCEGVKELVHLKSNHEEADTRLILHLIDRAENKDRRVLIKADDTDVLILLLYYFWDN
jgi:hypothetical protein